MDKPLRSPEEIANEIREKWIIEASKVPRGKRKKVVEMVTAGHCTRQIREALDLPLMIVMQIILEEFRPEAVL